MRRTLIHLAVISLVVGSSAGAALAQDSGNEAKAKKHLDRAAAQADAERWGEAAREIGAAYKLNPQPYLLFVWATAEKRNENCARAVELYEQFLGSSPSKQDAAEARKAFDQCKARLATSDAGAQPDPPGKVPVDPSTTSGGPDPGPMGDDPAPPSGGTEGTPWYKDPIGDALTIAGVVGVGVGISSLALANSSQSKADDAEFRDDFQKHLDDATTRRRIGGAALGIGSALIVGGVLRYVLRDDGKRDVSAAVSGDGMVYVLGSF